MLGGLPGVSGYGIKARVPVIQTRETGSPARHAENRKISFGFAFLAFQLGVVLLALWRFRIEADQGFTYLLPLIFGGFIVHHFLPACHRRKFFLALSFAGIFAVLPFWHGLVLIALGLGLIGLCHLPVSFRVRAGLIVFVAATLAAVRARWLTTPLVNELQQLVLPVLAAMFMFRLAIYLYDLSHETVPAALSERLSYFFLLPNVSFLLFPVVDYQTYRKSYYDGEALAIYQKGLLWMARGLVHLLLYRIVYQYFVPSAGEVHNLGTVVQFMVTSYLLYLRISGQFHLIAGILCLFGYNLPETHHLYFLSSGFNDFWRRINIYWKDFMMKMVYYPAFVPLQKRFGMTAGIVLATAAVFLGTWLLHSYQWFWLRNSFPIAASDGLFWGFLGLMVVINSLVEARRKKKRQAELTLGAALARSAKTVGFFALMSVLWSLWGSASPGEWLGIVLRAGNSGFVEFAQLAGVLAAAVAGGALCQFAFRNQSAVSVVNRPWLVPSSALFVTAVASALVFITLPSVRSAAGRGPEQFLFSLRQDSLNARDRELADRGYYEGLLNRGNLTSSLWSWRETAPDDWVGVLRGGITEVRNDLLGWELKASSKGSLHGVPFTTNRWRMRDKEYELPKPPGTYRIALVGASIETGTGVGDEETYEWVLEELLNGSQPNGAFSRVEILNFSTPSYDMVQKAIVAESRLKQFEPDLVIVTVYSTEHIRLLTHLTRAVAKNVPIPYADLQEIVQRAGANSWLGEDWVRVKLQPYVNNIIEWSFRKLKADSEKLGFPLAVLILPTTTDKDSKDAEVQLGEMSKGAMKAGLDTVRMDNVYRDFALSEVQVSPWDTHPNNFGCRLLAAALRDLILQREPRLAVKQTIAQ